MKTQTSFWALFGKNSSGENLSIEIPKIQRDYAQGRANAQAIRDGFLSSIFDALKNNESLKLDFVYGYKKEDKFIPLDGQQRLTTLFLLHYYTALKANKIAEICDKVKFDYEIRQSSREFCEKILCLKNAKNLQNALNSQKTISEAIKDQTWFFTEYEKDPTISGMLVMLDAIEAKFTKFTSDLNPSEILKPDEIWARLTHENLLHFEFLDMGEFKLGEELYIKMNARGKPLSDFENFKAKFIEKLKILGKDEHELSSQIKRKLDNEWLDIFWNFTNPNDVLDERTMKCDEKFLAFFQAILINLCYKDFFTANSNANTKSKKYNIDIKDLSNVDANDLLEYLNADKIKIIDKILDNIKICSENELLKSFNIIIGNAESTDDEGQKNRTKISSYDREKFFVDMQILAKTHELMPNFAKFKRVGENIVNNVLINRTEEFEKVLDFISNLAGGLNENDFYAWLKERKDDDFDDIKFELLEAQIKEEIKKAKLLQNEAWSEAIKNAEKHPYLNGQIGFLLDFAQNDLNEFKEYFKAFDENFPKTDEKDKENDFKFRRALLTKGIYFNQDYTTSLCNFNNSIRGRTYSWCYIYGVFNDESKKKMLKELLFELRTKNLQDIIDNYNEPNEWRHYLVKHKEMWEHCKNHSIRFNGEHIVLLSGSRNFSTGDKEFYTYALYLEYKIEHKNAKIDYQPLPSRNVDYLSIGIKIGDKIIVWHKPENSDKYGFCVFENENLVEIGGKNLSEKFAAAKAKIDDLLKSQN